VSTAALRKLLKSQGIEDSVIEQIVAQFSYHESICKQIKLPAESR
jgi:hypothetical protein